MSSLDASVLDAGAAGDDLDLDLGLGGGESDTLEFWAGVGVGW